MKEAIPWDDKPVISTDAVFKQIKNFVLALKESRARRKIIFTATELREALRKKRGITAAVKASLKSLTDAQLLTAVKNLSSQGFVRMLTLSSGEARILLVPELMNNLAASMVLEARRNERGLGAVEESRLFDNSYRFRELEKLSGRDPDVVFKDLFANSLSKVELLAGSTSKQGASLDLTYRISLRADATPTDLINQLNLMEGVQSVELQRGRS